MKRGKGAGGMYVSVFPTMERLHLGEFSSKDGRVMQCTEPTSEQLNILKQLGISPPPRVQKVDLTR